MANCDVLKEVLLQMQNLKLSSPLRTDQSKDDNKENILAGQDIQKSKTEGKSSDAPIIAETEENTPNQSACQEINGTDVNSNGKSEGSSPATPLITSSVLSNTVSNLTYDESSDSVIRNSECLVNDKNALNATVTSEVNNFSLDEPEKDCTLSNCEQKASTQSLYDDCVDVIGKNTEEYENDSNSLKKVSDNLNSTYAVDETFESLQEREESPCVKEPNTLETTDNILDCTQVIEEGSDITIIKYDWPSINSSETLNSEEKLQSGITHENSSAISEQIERCDHTFIGNSLDTVPSLEVESRNETFSSDSPVLPAEPPEDLQVPISNTEQIPGESKHCESLDGSYSNSIEKDISRNSSELDASLLNITKINCSVENLEKSTAKLVSDSSNGSLSTSPSSVQLSESITNNSSLDNSVFPDSCIPVLVTQQTISETSSSPEKIESSKILDLSIADCTTEVVNKSSSAFIILTPTKSENNRSFSEAPLTKDSLTDTSEQQTCELSCALTQTSNSFINKTSEVVEKINTSSVVIQNIEHSFSEVEDVLSTLAIKTEERQEVNQKIEVTSNIPKGKMEEINDKLQQEFSDTKLELNAAQQAKATLELEISKKDEIILKTQAEAMRKEQQYVQEIKVLKEQLKEKANNSINEKDLKDSKDSLKDLEEALKEAKAKEVDVMKVLEEYEKTIATRFSDYKKLKEENATVNRHLSNLELSFSDLHQKYEKAKSVIYSYKKNEEKLRNSFSVYEETFRKQEGRYESLKAHAQTQIDKCNIEILQQKEKSDSEISKLKAIVKRLEIKITSLETSLEQKTKECIDLAALCDEVTGKRF